MPNSTVEDVRLLTGHVAEWGELLSVLELRPGLTVVVADPWSGTSALLEGAVEMAPRRAALVDARGCADSLDLAMAIADQAVAVFDPGALSWWLGSAPASSVEGLRLWRTLGELGIDPEPLRLGIGDGDARLADALDLLAALAGGAAILIVDHLGRALATMRPVLARQVLDALRAGRQRHGDLDLLLVDYAGGRIAAALRDAAHPLYQAGSTLRLRRPTPDRFVEDLAITRALTDVPLGLLRAAAELASGVPELAWRTIDLAPPHGDDATRAFAGWSALRAVSEGSVRREWDLLRQVHSAAQPVVAAIGLGIKPHAAPLAPKSAHDALTRLRDTGLAWQPAERTWAVSDPLLAAWARDHPPPWARRARRRP